MIRLFFYSAYRIVNENLMYNVNSKKWYFRKMAILESWDLGKLKFRKMDSRENGNQPFEYY